MHATLPEDGRVVPLIERRGRKLTKLVIPTERFAALRAALDKCGVNAGSLFPDLDGLTRHIEWYYYYYDDDAEMKAAAAK